METMLREIIPFLAIVTVLLVSGCIQPPDGTLVSEPTLNISATCRVVFGGAQAFPQYIDSQIYLKATGGNCENILVNYKIYSPRTTEVIYEHNEVAQIIPEGQFNAPFTTLHFNESGVNFLLAHLYPDNKLKYPSFSLEVKSGNCQIEPHIVTGMCG